MNLTLVPANFTKGMRRSWTNLRTNRSEQPSLVAAPRISRSGPVSAPSTNGIPDPAADEDRRLTVTRRSHEPIHFQYAFKPMDNDDHVSW